MMKRTGLVAGVVCAVLGSVVPALAQQPSLAEVARQEAARRKDVESSKKVYTDKDLNKGRPLTTGASAPVTQAAETTADAGAPSGGATTDKAPAPKAAATADDPRLVELRMALATATDGAKAAQQEAEKAAIAIVTVFDEATRNAEIAKRDARVSDARKYQATVDALTKEIAELEEAARKAAPKAPPQ